MQGLLSQKQVPEDILMSVLIYLGLGLVGLWSPIIQDTLYHNHTNASLLVACVSRQLSHVTPGVQSVRVRSSPFESARVRPSSFDNRVRPGTKVASHFQHLCRSAG